MGIIKIVKNNKVARISNTIKSGDKVIHAVTMQKYYYYAHTSTAVQIRPVYSSKKEIMQCNINLFKLCK